MKNIIKAVLDISDFKKQLLLNILFCFLGAYTVVRVYSLTYGHSIFVRGYQIHHFYFGTLFLTIGAIVALLTDAKKYKWFASGLVGVGIGLFADELGLLLNCTTRNHACSYIFPDQYDFLGYITVSLIILIVLLSMHQHRTKINKD